MGITRVRKDGIPVSSDAFGDGVGARIEHQQEKKLFSGKKVSEVRMGAAVSDDFVDAKEGKLEGVHGETNGDGAGGGWSANQLLCELDSDRVFPHSTSRIAALNRELKALEVRYFRTRMQLEKSMEKVCVPLFTYHGDLVLNDCFGSA